MFSPFVIFANFVAVFILGTWALYLPFRAGQLYNGPVFSMAIGGYAGAFLVGQAHWAVPWALLAAVVAGTLLGFLPGLAFGKASGIAAAMASIALIFIIQALIGAIDILGGPVGLLGLPHIGYLPALAYGLVMSVGFLLWRVERSRLATVMDAVGQIPEMAACSGVNLVRFRVALITASAAIASLAGFVLAFTVGSVKPETFSFALLLNLWTMLFVGGRYTPWGTLVAAPVLWGIPQWLPENIASYSQILMGVLLVVVMIVRPQGLVTRSTPTYFKKSVYGIARTMGRR